MIGGEKHQPGPDSISAGYDAAATSRWRNRAFPCLLENRSSKPGIHRSVASLGVYRPPRTRNRPRARVSRTAAHEQAAGGFPFLRAQWGRQEPPRALPNESHLFVRIPDGAEIVGRRSARSSPNSRPWGNEIAERSDPVRESPPRPRSCFRPFLPGSYGSGVAAAAKLHPHSGTMTLGRRTVARDRDFPLIA